jgi:hypothetical protein
MTLSRAHGEDFAHHIVLCLAQNARDLREIVEGCAVWKVLISAIVHLPLMLVDDGRHEIVKYRLILQLALRDQLRVTKCG